MPLSANALRCCSVDTKGAFFRKRTLTKGNWLLNSHNRPQLEGVPLLKFRVSVIEEVEPTFAVATGERLNLSEPQGVKRSRVFFEVNLDDYSVLAGFLVD
jgi:hypothetical protein